MKRSEYKVAAIMLTILNLPREERSKKNGQLLQVCFVVAGTCSYTKEA